MPIPGTPASLHQGGWFDFHASSWNLFRLSGDFLHAAGTILLVVSILMRRGTTGISWKSQFLYFVVFSTRYLDLPRNIHEYWSDPKMESRMLYLIIFKSSYIFMQLLILALFGLANRRVGTGYDRTANPYEPDKDTFSIWFVLLPYLLFSYFFAEERTFLEVMWTYSEYLEAFCMVPQYIFQYRSGARSSFVRRVSDDFSFRGAGKSDRHSSVFMWICCIGTYRCFYFANWIWKSGHNDYVPAHSWIGGGLQCLLFFDFLLFYVTGISCIKSVVIAVDDRVNDAGDAIELKAFPARAPEVEQKRLRRRNQTENAYQNVPTEIADPTMVGRPDYDDIL